MKARAINDGLTRSDMCPISAATDAADTDTFSSLTTDHLGGDAAAAAAAAAAGVVVVAATAAAAAVGHMLA